MSLRVISAEAIKTVIEFETDAAFQTRCLQNRFSAGKEEEGHSSRKEIGRSGTIKTGTKVVEATAAEPEKNKSFSVPIKFFLRHSNDFSLVLMVMTT